MNLKRSNKIRQHLLRWYAQNHRDLPWRLTRDPYAIWVAETMLQQTQVKTVLPYYRRFLESLPTIQALDQAPMDKVLALWSGLGYYRRAENLKKAARELVRNYQGAMPKDFMALRALPGIGAYTAGALMSIAFDKPYPALDGNARRVLARLLDVGRGNDLLEIAKQLVSPSQPGRFNQALMEIGATVCLPRNPQCPRCPLVAWCVASKSKRFHRAPGASSKRKTRSIEWPLILIQNREKILLRRRRSGALLARLWEVPGGERQVGERLVHTLSRNLNGIGKLARFQGRIGEVRHSITFRKIHAPVFLFSTFHAKRSSLPDSTWRWLSISVLPRYPLSSLSLKAIKVYLER